MQKKIAILRGINVGGKRRILMSDLRDLFIKLGFEDVQTYIQSGNVIFKSDEKVDNISIKIQNAILKMYGFEVPVIVLTSQELKITISNNLFSKSENIDIERLHLTFLKEKPTKENITKVNSKDFSPDKFLIIEKNIFIF